MRGKFIALSCLATLIMAGNAFGAIVFDTQEEKPETPKNFVEIDTRLPPYNNPVEADLKDGKLHLSFKGIFRREGAYKNLIRFIFVAVASEDMDLKVEKSTMFDRRGKRYSDWRDIWIGGERSSNRPIPDYIPIVIALDLYVPEIEAEKFPTVGRVKFSFNGQEFQFRNIKVKEWALWEGLMQELGL